MLNRKVNRGVILAAGDGGRLGLLTTTCPKVLLSVNNKTLISYSIEALVDAGITEIAIVVGYLGNQVVEVLGNGSNFGVTLHYVFNSDYLGGNAISVYQAKDWAQGDPIVLCMGDHLIEKTLVRRLLDSKTLNDTLCIDNTPVQHHQLAEATKVIIDKAGCIKGIGKDITCWDALDTGVFLLTENFFRALDKLVPKFGIDIEITDVIRFLISQGYCFDTCDVSGCFWADIDTEEDLNMVEIVE